MHARCPSCDSVYLTRFIELHDELRLAISEHVVLKGKDPSLSAKRRLRREVRSGLRPEGNGSGRVVDEHRVVDADLDLYEERIVDAGTGQVIRDVSEPLSKHRGGTQKS